MENAEPVYKVEPSTEPGHVDISFPRIGWAQAETHRYWAKVSSGRTFIVYAKDTPTAVRRMMEGAPPGALGMAWELYDTPLPEAALVTDVRTAPGS